jgi:hypothetical protein
MDGFKAMDDGRMRLRDTTEYIVLAIVVAGFALAFGWAIFEIDVAVKATSSSLGTIATIGN